MNRLQKYEQLVQVRFPAHAEKLVSVRATVRDVLNDLDCSEKFVESTVLAVDEAVCNVIRHAYPEGDQGDVVLEIERSPEVLLVRVTDFAEPLDAKAIRTRDLDEVRPGGLGVFLMRQIMDKVEYSAPATGGGNVLIMTRRLEHP